MEGRNKNKINVRLKMSRKRIGLGQKQVALLLGHKSTGELSRYENGVSLPPFETAVRLEIILGVPVSQLFENFYQELRELVTEKARETKVALASSDVISKGNCSYWDDLLLPYPSDSARGLARDHTTMLANKLAYL
jgi:transcriptional regulator with XRE-family HTH domain